MNLKFQIFKSSSQRPFYKYLFSFVAIFAFSLCYWGDLLAEVDESAYHLEKGYSLFQSALQEKNVPTRVKLLNDALTEYLAVRDATSNGEISANIGAIYFYLGDPALSTLYLFKAQSLCPRHLGIHEMVQSLQKYSDLEGRWFPYSWYEIASGKSLFSPSERIAILLFFLFLATLLFSFTIWFSSYGLKIAMRMSAFLFAGLFFMFLLLPLLVEKEKVIVQERAYLKMSETMQQDKSSNSAGSSNVSVDSASLSFVIPGEELIVLSKDPNNEWLRVKTTRGSVGYISGKSTRPLI